MVKKDDFTIELYHANEFSQVWDDMTHKLRTGKGFDASAFPSICYLLREKKYDRRFPHKIISNHLDKNAPQYCIIVDLRQVSVKAKSINSCPPHEGTCVGSSYCWEYPKLLNSVVAESGFNDVKEWLDSWMHQKQTFEYDVEHTLWLVKIYYPHMVQSPIKIQNDATKPIPTRKDDNEIGYA